MIRETLQLRPRVGRALRRQLRNMPPGRRLRVRQALHVVERYAGGQEKIRLLDAGSEEGLLCLEIARRHPNWTLVAADIAQDALARGRRWAGVAGVRVHYVRCDLQRSLVHSRFDVVVALESLEEIPDDAAAIASLAGALRQGGLFVAHVPTADWTPVLPGAQTTWRREVRHGYVAADLAAALTAAELKIETIKPTFRRTTALAQDVRDRLKPTSKSAKLAMLPFMAGAVALESAGLTWGPPRGLLVVATRR